MTIFCELTPTSRAVEETKSEGIVTILVADSTAAVITIE